MQTISVSSDESVTVEVRQRELRVLVEGDTSNAVLWLSPSKAREVAALLLAQADAAEVGA